MTPGDWIALAALVATVSGSVGALIVRLMIGRVLDRVKIIEAEQTRTRDWRHNIVVPDLQSIFVALESKGITVPPRRGSDD